jgi:hypothetical protein
MIRRMNVAWMSAITMAGVLFAHGQTAPGKEDDGADRGASAVAAQEWSVAVPGWKPVTANEHPRLIFRKDDVPTLRKRAQSPAGKVIIERAKTLLEAPFTTWHAAGHAFLYQVTGDQAWADKAREAAEQTLAGKANPDGRYTWPGEGQLRAGPCLSAVALAYDMAYDGWDAATRAKIAQGHSGKQIPGGDREQSEACSGLQSQNSAEVLPLSMVDEGPGYCVFRNGWADKGNIVVTALPKTPTSLAVDYSGASGAPLLVAQVGPQVGHRVEYWMDVKKLNLPKDVKDVTGEDGFATKTTIHTAAPAMPWAIMTLQKGDPPAVVVDGNTVKVGGQTLTFDGEKIVLGR